MSKENHLDTNNLLEDNLEFLGKALQFNFEGIPRGTCTKFVEESKNWCGSKALEGSDRCFQHHNTDSKILNSINRANALERNRKVVVCKNTYRVMLKQSHTEKFVRYCPSIEGAMPAFDHSTRNLKKFLKAAFKVYRQMKHEQKSFSEVPFKNEFPNAITISRLKWKHSYKAVRETIRIVL